MNSVLSIIQNESCINCGACHFACPVQAIHVKEDDLFYHAEIDIEKCVNCGKCVQICPVLSGTDEKMPNEIFYGTYKDLSVVKNSSSGGAFFALANTILKDGGIVFGASYENDCKSVRICSTEKKEICSFMKSKYVESLTGDSFLDVSNRVNANQTVLYCGSPCQIAGLKRFLGYDPQNLYTCDFICGGFPSHMLYQEYLHALENRYQSRVIQVDFRPKTLGWETYAIKIQFANGKVYHQAAALDPYFSAFVNKHYSVRKNCGRCQFYKSHESDITLGDFWQYRDFIETTGNNSGISILCANSEKGLCLIEKAMTQMNGGQLNRHHAISAIFKMNSETALWEKGQDEFLISCLEDGLSSAAQKYCLPDRKKRMLIRAKSAMKYLLRRVK